MNRAYKNACQNDLWDALTEQAQTDRVMDKTLTVKDVMDTWILQPGFPVINVTRDYKTDSLIVSQVNKDVGWFALFYLQTAIS